MSLISYAGFVPLESAISISPARWDLRILAMSAACSGFSAVTLVIAASAFTSTILSGNGSANILAALEQWCLLDRKRRLRSRWRNCHAKQSESNVGNFPTEDLVLLLEQMDIRTEPQSRGNPPVCARVARLLGVSIESYAGKGYTREAVVGARR